MAYASRHLNDSERRYAAIEREALAVIFGIRKFRHYLLDNPFTVISDHRPLQWLSNCKDTTSRLARWAVELAGTKNTFRPGKVHQNADCLSRIRCVQVSSIKEETPLLVSHQKSDHLCQEILRYMDTGELSELHQRHPPIWVKEIELYTVINGVLCCYYEPTSRKRRQITQLQAVLPYSLRKEILQHYHDSPHGGHFSYFKTSTKVRDRYY